MSSTISEDQDNRPFNKEFTIDEIANAIAKLKKRKAAGADQIINEFLKNCPRTLIGLLTRWFNLIIESGVVPKEWGIGIIQPIYKKKGSPNEPDNYRGITLLSCVSKLFTSVINNRLNEFVEINGIIGHEQAGFRRGYSTVDHIFALHCIIVYYLSKKKRVYAAFLDYRKAFDLVDRRALWTKVIQSGITGKVLHVIRNLYAQAKSCVRGVDGVSDFFVSGVGVRQGENLSPLLFALYLNDFKSYIDRASTGLSDISAEIGSSCAERQDGQGDLDIFIKLSVLMYADDTLLLAETERDLQMALNATSEYCRRWAISINPTKTRVMVFSRGKVRNLPVLTLEGVELEVSFEFTYLGACINYNASFKKAISQQVRHAERALHALRSKMRCMNLPFDIASHLFNNMISPILLYAAEVWAFEDLQHIDVFHRKFLKREMGLRKSTPSCMVYGETDGEKLSLIAERRMLVYWYKIAGPEGTGKLSGILYRALKDLHLNGTLSFNWLDRVRDRLNGYGFGGLWDSQDSLNNPLWFKEAIKLRMSDVRFQEWEAEVTGSPLCFNFRLIKDRPCFNEIIRKIPIKDSKVFFRFRCANFALPVYPHIQSLFDSERCHLCDSDRGDEFHYLLVCQNLQSHRESHINKKFWRKPNTVKFQNLLNSKSISVIRKLISFLKIIHSTLNTRCIPD